MLGGMRRFGAGISRAALAGAFVLCGGAGQADPLPVSGAGFLRVLPEDAAPAYVEVAGETRATPHAAATTPPRSLPVSEGGTIAVDLAAFPPLPAGAMGYRIAYQFRDPSPLSPTKRTAHTFVPSDDLSNGPLALVPPGVPAPTAVVQARAVWPVARRWAAPPLSLPQDATLAWAVGLRQDWRVARDAGACFTVALEHAGKWHILDQHSVRVADGPGDASSGWVPRAADLARFAGETVRLHFITQPVAGAPEPQFAEPLWSTPLLYTAPAPEPPPGPNVLLICLDTVRADRLGIHGYPRGTSPNLDAFAADAAVFEQAIAPAPWTTPTHASVFTGYHPDVHRAGVISAGYHLAPEWTTLAEILRDAGRVTAAYTEGIAIRGQMGFAQGFDVYSDGHSPDRHIKERAPRTFGDALAWLRTFGHLPFFLYVQTYEAHEPYGAPEEFARRFIQGDLPLRGAVMGADAHSPEERQRVSDLYDAAIAYTDAELGRFLDGVRDLGLLEDTLVVIFSDHGEEFWEHGAVGHTRHVYDEVLRVPLVVRVPGRAGAGQRIARQVDLTDVFATVLAHTGHTPPPDTDSVSLLPLLEARDGYAREAVVSVLVNTSGDLLTAEGLPVEWRRAARRTESKKYIHSDREVHEGAGQPAEEFYKLEADPAERENHATESPAELDAQRARLQQFEADKAAVRARHATTDAPGLSPEDIDALQSLGYL